MIEIAPNIIINPEIRGGQPVIKGTRITVDEALGFLIGGMGFDDIESEYNLTKDQVASAVNYAAGFLKREGVELVAK